MIDLHETDWVGLIAAALNRRAPNPSRGAPSADQRV
jgi:hypothetical protein